jgi:hypothetical protein
MSETMPEGSGEVEFDFDLSPFEDEPATPAASTGEPRENPAWAPIKEKIPKEFWPTITPELQKWDQGVQQQFQKLHQQYAPYDDFRKNNVTPDQLQAGYNLFQQLNASPVDFFNNLRGVLEQNGMMPAEAAAKAAEITQQQTGEDPDVYEDPRISELARQQAEIKAQQDQFLQSIQQQAEQQASQQKFDAIQSSLGNQMASLEQRVGALPEWLAVEVYNRTASLSERYGREVSIVEAYADWQKMYQAAQSIPRPGAQAPRVVPSGGGYPSQQPNPDALKSQDGRAEAGLAIVRRLRGE